jgi:MoCo/4Fe-4S cofactor protein with predicted Tat translocation signal
MKRKWHHPEPEQTRGKLIRGIGELEDTPEFRGWLEREFPAGAAEMQDGNEQENSRRSFLKLMGASTALAGFGLAACRRPEQHIRPFSKAVEWIIPGKPLYYATAMPRLGGCTPLVVVTHEGRPTHLQPNPLHPKGKGVDSFATSSILDLYDPERSSTYLYKGNRSSAEDFGTFLNGQKKTLAAGSGKGLAILYGESTSLTRARLVTELRTKFPQAKFFRYEPLAPVKIRAATEALSGKGATLSYDLSKADAIVSIGADFLGLDRIGEDAPAAFARRRSVDDPEVNAAMNRLYVLEHAFSVTGGMADHRLPVNASQLGKAAVLLARAIAGATGDAALTALAGSFKGSVDTAGLDPVWIAAAAKDLASKKGRSLVLAGSRLESGVHALVAGMNAALQAYGATVNVLPGEPDEALGLADLTAAIHGKEVTTLVITTEADPVYDAPSDLKFGEALAGVDSVIHVGVRSKCATARAATWHVPGAHYLESWGDVRASDGTYSVVQPMILPLYNGVSEIAFYLDLLADPPVEGAKKEEAAAPVPGAPAPDDAAMLAVKSTFAEVAKAAALSDAEKAWDSALRDGFVPGTTAKPATTPPDVAAGHALVAALTDTPAPSRDALEVVFTADSKVFDGRYINNGWQQEAPDSITKIVWDNAALVGIKTLKALGLPEKDLAVHDETRLLKLTVNGVESYFPILPAPGHSQNSISISMGYGQEDCGKVGGGNDGSGTGFNVFPLRTASTDFIATGATVEIVTEAVEIRPGQKMKVYPLALTQEHNSMEGRALMRDGTFDEFKDEHTKAGAGHHGKSAFQARGMDSHIPENISVYRGQTFDFEDTHQWGMTVDLNSCLGCSSCLVACQSENNIPIVGKEQVIIGREMHWIRMDRYFAPNTKQVERDDHTHEWINDDEDLDNPQMLPQPVACQQCEAAPCETVCPVNATVHNEEGLNAMAYNRCIGTRYCANNCPYKARRFNFFDYNKRPLDQLYLGPLSDKDQTGVRESLKLQKNPNVTVRMRGVMEKCTYCVQRLQEAKIRRKQIARDQPEKLAVPDGAVKTACQAACPTEAIIFGDLRDKNSAVSKSKESIRNYDLLAYLGVRPRTSYLARIKNPNSEIPGADQVGTVTAKLH